MGRHDMSAKAVALINCATELVKIAGQIKRKKPGAREAAIQSLAKLGEMCGEPAADQTWSDGKLMQGCIAMATDLCKLSET